MQSTPAQQRVSQQLQQTTTTTTTTTTAPIVPTETEAARRSFGDKASSGITNIGGDCVGVLSSSAFSKPPATELDKSPEVDLSSGSISHWPSSSRKEELAEKPQQQRQVGSPAKQFRTTTTSNNNNDSYLANKAHTALPSTSSAHDNSGGIETTPAAEVVVLEVTGEGGKTSGDSVDRTHRNNNTSYHNRDTNKSKIQQHPQIIEACPVLESVGQNNIVDQGIKVTLSAPRNSTDIQVCEPILIESTKPLPIARRRQSTATLIEASEVVGPFCEISSSQIKEVYVPTVAQQTVPPLNRSQQENELRRIASQRLRKDKGPIVVVPDEEVGQTIGQSPTLKPVQTSHQAPEPQNPKQLAIYINGKIRSNSIFCRSSSSNSFNGILNRFHGSNNNPNQVSTNCRFPDGNLSPGARVCLNDKQSPLRLCRQSSKRQGSGSKASRRSLSRKQQSSVKPTHSLRQKRHFSANLRQSFRNFLTNHQPLDDKSDLCQDKRRTSQYKNNQESVKKSSSQLSFKNSSGGGSQSTLGAPEQESSYKLNPSSMFLRKAMRYYRLWIYCTNITILLGTLIFILSAIYVMSDYRIKLLVSPPIKHNTNNINSQAAISSKRESIESNRKEATFEPGPAQWNGEPKIEQEAAQPPQIEEAELYRINISYTEPYVILAYVAIAIQAGLLQAIGCFGAIRMKERWIQAFYYLILALIALDVMLLMGWLNRYDFIVKSLHDHMSFRLKQHYGGGLRRHSNSNDSSLSSHQQHLPHLSYQQLADNSNSYNNNLFSVTQEIDSKLDKILTEIIDKIQTDSQCCGITNSLDYEHSNWRWSKLEQLKVELNWTAGSEGRRSFVANLMSRVPLVPASCCRRTDSLASADKQASSGGGRPVILDDAQIERPNRVPAWSPSMVVEHLRQQQASPMGRPLPPAKAHAHGSGNGKVGHHESEIDVGDIEGGSQFTLADLIDGRWTGASPGAATADSSSYLESGGSGKLERRLLAKQDSFRRPPPVSGPAESGDHHQLDRERRWVVESMVDEKERVLTRLIDGEDSRYDEDLSGDPSAAWNGLDLEPSYDFVDEDEDLTERRQSVNQVQLTKLRRILFHGSIGMEGKQLDNNENLCRLNDGSCFTIQHFRWPNKLHLDFDQYKTIESYLLKEESEPDLDLQRGKKLQDESPPPEVINSSVASARLRRYSTVASHQSRQSPAWRHNQSSQVELSGNCHTNDCRPLVRISRKSTSSDEIDEAHHSSRLIEPATGSSDEAAAAAATLTKGELEMLKLLRRTLQADPETGCAPRSYYDLKTIHTRGCYPDIKSWLDSSAHILFVTGFCILTVLKFCSVVLLRLEIREMIHKIKVLKGMATEYNALHDLEAYLPRPSVSAQAAELTPGGAFLATALPGPCVGNSATNIMSPTSTAAAAGSGLVATGSMGPMPVNRLGGSFSEAVAAATAAAHGGLTGGLGLGGLANSGRAASMKAMAAMSNMLTPTLCPRSSSASAAHLQAAASLLGGGSHQHQKHGSFSLRSDPFQANGMMSRRHTAISVCPQAAAAAAAAAAHHLMSRRGTYVANPMFDGAPTNLMSSGSNLFQHRHSAHTVHSLLTTRPQSQQQQVAGTSGGRQQHASKRSSRHYLGDTPSGGPTIEHQSSGESNQLTSGQQPMNRSSGGSHQLLSLVYPFKRQSSGGAQSACNFSLDLGPALSAESRRSIH